MQWPVDEDTARRLAPFAFAFHRTFEPRALGTRDVLRFALDHAPAYMHPRAIWFLDRLPLNTTNKIDRKLLQQRAAATRLSSAAR